MTEHTMNKRFTLELANVLLSIPDRTCFCKFKDEHPFVEFLLKEFSAEEIFAIDCTVVGLGGVSFLNPDRDSEYSGAQIFDLHCQSGKIRFLLEAMVIVYNQRGFLEPLQLRMKRHLERKVVTEEKRNYGKPPFPDTGKVGAPGLPVEKEPKQQQLVDGEPSSG